MPAHKIDFYFNSSDSLRVLTQRAQGIAELQQVFLKNAPQQLTQACCVKQLRAGTLVLLAGNAAVAAKLKQLVPRLLTAYGKLGLQVTAIRVEVQVSEGAPEIASASPAKRLSLDSIKSLENLAERLEDSPLKQAITRMAARQRKNDSS